MRIAWIQGLALDGWERIICSIPTSSWNLSARARNPDVVAFIAEQPRLHVSTILFHELTYGLVERASGRLIEGDPKHPQEVVEVWTFVRAPGGTERAWVLSAIQEA